VPCTHRDHDNKGQCDRSERWNGNYRFMTSPWYTTTCCCCIIWRWSDVLSKRRPVGCIHTTARDETTNISSSNGYCTTIKRTCNSHVPHPHVISCTILLYGQEVGLEEMQRCESSFKGSEERLPRCVGEAVEMLAASCPSIVRAAKDTSRWPIVLFWKVVGMCSAGSFTSWAAL
jgi:hypothetical protein